MQSAEAELENFRQQWREEVSAKSKSKDQAFSAPSKASQPSSSKAPASRSGAPDFRGRECRPSIEEDTDVQPHAYDESDEKKHGRTLDETSPPSNEEPRSALEHYERAVDQESRGKMGESLDLYRKAFRLDSNVHQVYKNKHFPASSFAPSKSKLQDSASSSARNTVSDTAHPPLNSIRSNLQSMIQEFSSLSIEGEPAPTDLSPKPPCPIASIPEELLTEILIHLAIQDVSSLVRLAQVCKRLAYLITTEDRVWKRISLGSEFGFEAMHYSFACQINGKPIGDDGEGGRFLGSHSKTGKTEEEEEEEEEDISQSSVFQHTSRLVPSIYPNYRTLFHRRPRIRFNGCYISTVNYTRPGASSPTSVSWNSPIHIVTYYRYLRFLRDGTCISLLTTSEPSDVVPFLRLEHMHKNHGNLPSAPMKDALLGRWRLSGPSALENDDEEGEKEGTLHVETEGATPKYIYKMILSLGSAGNKARNNKLTWQGYWSYNLVTDDWAEFMMRTYRPYYFSRVKSFGMAWDEVLSEM